MKLQPSTVVNKLKIWNCIFPYRKTDEELALVSAKFFKILNPYYSDEAFCLAADMIEESEEQFPTIAHMKKLVNVVADKIVRDRELDLSRKALPEETDLTEEEVEQNNEKMKIIKDMLAGKMDIEEAIKRQKALEHFVAK